MPDSALVIYSRAAGLGFVSGLRSVSPLAAMSRAAARQPAALAHTPFAVLADRRMATLLTLSAGGEFVVDKLPFTHARTEPFPLTVRVVLGGLAGAAACTLAAEAPLGGAVLGAAAAVLGTFVGYTARQRTAGALRVSSQVAGLLEDAVVVAASLVLERGA